MNFQTAEIIITQIEFSRFVENFVGVPYGTAASQLVDIVF